MGSLRPGKGRRKRRLATSLCAAAFATAPGCAPRDADRDGVLDRADNCTRVANPDQSDADLDGFGDGCDADYDQDGATGAGDFRLLRAAFGALSIDARYPLALDHDANGSVDGEDFREFRRRFGRPPGPSGLACAGRVPCAPASAEPLPNLVLIISDDQGYRDFGFMGSPVVRTPHLDALAREGAVFRTGYATESVCRPAMRSLLTGLYPHQWTDRVGALRERSRERAPRRAAERASQRAAERAAKGGRRARRRGADAEAPRAPARPRGFQRAEWEEVLEFQTLPRLLAQRGYASFQAGKYWEGTFDLAGFDQGTAAVLDRSHVGGQYGGRPAGIGRTSLEPIFQFLEQQAHRPFLLWFAPLLPHLPHDAPAEYLEPYQGLGLPAPVEQYYANITRLDAVVGLLLAKLEELGLRERTLVAFTVDNGWEQPQTALEDWREGLGGPRGKGTLSELGFRTPIVLSWPGRVPPGVVFDQPVSSVDLFATLLAYAGIRADPHRDGWDLRPLIEGRDPSAVRARIAGRRGSTALFLRDARWHYVYHLPYNAVLYDVQQDPDETTDVSDAFPELEAELRARTLEELDRHARQIAR